MLCRRASSRAFIGEDWDFFYLKFKWKNVLLFYHIHQKKSQYISLGILDLATLVHLALVLNHIFDFFKKPFSKSEFAGFNNI